MQNKISINEKGFIRNMSRLGFTKNQSFAEIFTNSIDAGATKIHIEKNKKNIKIIDNGKGMNNVLLRNKYDLMKQRKRDKNTTGCAGIGGTTSEFILAKIKSVVISKMIDDKIVVAEVDWNRVYKEHKLFDSITFREATKEEEDEFNLDREDEYGTTTILYYDQKDEDEVTKILKNQFHKNNKLEINHFERFDIIFGLKNCEFTFKHWKYPIKKLELYDLRQYIKDENNYKFTNKEIHVYRLLVSDEYIYICDNKKISFKKNLMPYIKKGETELVAIIKLNIYNPYDKTRFDYDNPYELPKVTSNYNEYEKNFFRSNEVDDRDFIQETQVYRNNHYLGTKKIFTNRSNARGDGKSKNKLYHTRSFIEYYVESSENENENILDDIFGVQLNKNQNNHNTLPIPLARLIEGLINEFHIETWQHFDDTIVEFKKNKLINYKNDVGTTLISNTKAILNNKEYSELIDEYIKKIETFILDSQEDELINLVNKLRQVKNKLTSNLNKFKNSVTTIEKYCCKYINEPNKINKLINDNSNILTNVNEFELLSYKQLTKYIVEKQRELMRNNNFIDDRTNKQNYEKEENDTSSEEKEDNVTSSEEKEENVTSSEEKEENVISSEEKEENVISSEEKEENVDIEKDKFDFWIKRKNELFTEAKDSLIDFYYKQFIIE